MALALALRLLVWRWHEQYPLGGDEREYLNQALTLLQKHRYEDLLLMRPPLYTFFLAGCIYLFDSLVQRLRLIQALVSTLTVVPVYLLTRRLFGSRKIAIVAALLAALSYTLAANATELLTETLFLFGLTTLLWLLLAVGEYGGEPRDAGGRTGIARSGALVAGVYLGALALLRSVALPLLPLGGLWLLWTTDDRRPTMDDGRWTIDDATAHRPPPTVHRDPGLGTGDLGRAANNAQAPSPKPQAPNLRPRATISRLTGRDLLRPIIFLVAAALAITPWTVRNYVTYGGLILIDTTGAENLWLDNNPAGATQDDPLGREAAKRQLYALGADRLARQRLAVQRGTAALLDSPGWFVAKAWGEAKKFFALQYFDDMRERRAIWVPPAEVWLRVLLGDGVWLVLLVCGAIGLWLAPTEGRGRRTEDGGPPTADGRPPTGDDAPRRVTRSPGHPATPATSSQLPTPISRLRLVADARWLLVPWALYTLLTAVIFHVELRYRLPLYPVLLPYAAWTICRIADWGRSSSKIQTRKSKIVYASLTLLAVIGLTLLHRPYVGEAWMLARKHYRLWQAERALAAGDVSSTIGYAGAAGRLDSESALARVMLARAALARGDRQSALASLDDAIALLRAHPYAHLLRGALLREQGQLDAAREELSFERASLEDLQEWSWRAFAPFAHVPAAIDVGGGLDLGFVRGFYPAESGFRWAGAEAQVLLSSPGGDPARLQIRLSAGRPAEVPSPTVTLSIGGRAIGQIAPSNEWQVYRFPIPPELRGSDGHYVVSIRSDTFRPRDYDRASPDARDLGVMVGKIDITQP